MSRILAVDWDEHEARYVLASAQRGKVSIISATSVPLVDVVEGGSDPQPDLANSLRLALADRKLGHPKTLVAVDRRSIELLHLTLPPATDKELPHLVANAAMRESATVTEQSVLDFVPDGVDPAQPRAVTAAVISAEQLEHIKNTCAVAGLKPRRLLMRPYASASLFARGSAETEQPCLLVNLVGCEVDLTVFHESRVVYSRTARLPEAADETTLHNRLIGEINRTLAVAIQGCLAGESIESIFIFGSPGERQALIDQLNETPGISATHFDPFAVVEAPEGPIPEGAGRFAALLGMVLDETQGGARHGSHAIDFLHPRKAAKPPNPRRRAAMAGALVMAALSAGGFQTWSNAKTIDEENYLLERELTELNQSVKLIGKQEKLIAAVGRWQASDVLWLEELREISLRFPADQEAVILRMSLGPPRSGSGGVMTFQTLVRDSSTVRIIEELRDRFHRVRTPGARRRAGQEDYPWYFDATVDVAWRPSSRYTSHLPRETP